MSVAITPSMPSIQPYEPATPPSEQDKNVALAKMQVNHHQQMVQSYQYGANANEVEETDQSESQDEMQQALELSKQIQRAETLNTVSQHDPIADRYQTEQIETGIAINTSV